MYPGCNPGCNPDVGQHGGGLEALVALYPPYVSPYLPTSPHISRHPGAHAFMLLPRRSALERRLSAGLAFLDKCRLLAKVDGDVNPNPNPNPDPNWGMLTRRACR